MSLHSFANARRARGLPILAGPGRLNAATAAELRVWRYYIGRLTLPACDALAGVPPKTWAKVEWGGAVHADRLERVLDAWGRAVSGDLSPAAKRDAPPADAPAEQAAPAL